MKKLAQKIASRSTSLPSRVALFGLIVALAGCDRSPREPQASDVSAASSHTQPVRSGPDQDTEHKNAVANSASALPAPKIEPATGIAAARKQGADRMVAIGDLHGDLAATERAFRLAGAIDAQGKWVGGKLIVVQTGDQLDRGDDEALILRFLERLQQEAEQAGGHVYVLNGNHESMNVLGDFRYVTSGALHAFDDVQPASPRAQRVSGPFASRARAFLPGGGMAQKLAERPTVLIVGDTVFSHGGVLPEHLKYGIDRLNEEASAWMRGERQNPPEPLIDPEGPVWTRVYGEPSLSAQSCAMLASVLGALQVKRLVVGHTVQQGGLSEACDGQVARIDVGLSKYYGDHPVQVLEITAQGTRTLTEK